MAVVPVKVVKVNAPAFTVEAVSVEWTVRLFAMMVDPVIVDPKAVTVWSVLPVNVEY